MLTLERQLARDGFRKIAGIDEVGRGALAGPVVAAAVILPPGLKIRGLRDSKELSSKQRDYYFNLIKVKAETWSVARVGSAVIDRTNILQALQLAMQRAYTKLDQRPDQLLIDGRRFFTPSITAQFIVKGDMQVQSIAAASIIAKVTRDRMMARLERKFPYFSFAAHKGYGTQQHFAELKKHGPSNIHRHSFAPVS
jgi:ribonuclease HII